MEPEVMTVHEAIQECLLDIQEIVLTERRAFAIQDTKHMLLEGINSLLQLIVADQDILDSLEDDEDDDDDGGDTDEDPDPDPDDEKELPDPDLRAKLEGLFNYSL